MIIIENRFLGKILAHNLEAIQTTKRNWYNEYIAFIFLFMVHISFKNRIQSWKALFHTSNKDIYFSRYMTHY